MRGVWVVVFGKKCQNRRLLAAHHRAEVEEPRSEAENPLTRPAADLSLSLTPHILWDPLPEGEGGAVEKTRAPGQSPARPTRDRPRPNGERVGVRGVWVVVFVEKCQNIPDDDPGP